MPEGRYKAKKRRERAALRAKLSRQRHQRRSRTVCMLKWGTTRSRHRRQSRYQVVDDIYACYDLCGDRGSPLDFIDLRIGSEVGGQDNPFGLLNTEGYASAPSSPASRQSDLTFTLDGPSFLSARDACFSEPLQEPFTGAFSCRRQYEPHSAVSQSENIADRSESEGSLGNITSDDGRLASFTLDGMLWPLLPPTHTEPVIVELPGPVPGYSEFPRQAIITPGDPTSYAGHLPEDYSMLFPLLFSPDPEAYMSGGLIEESHLIPKLLWSETPTPKEIDAERGAVNIAQPEASTQEFVAAALPLFDHCKDDIISLRTTSYHPSADNGAASVENWTLNEILHLASISLEKSISQSEKHSRISLETIQQTVSQIVVPALETIRSAFQTHDNDLQVKDSARLNGPGWLASAVCSVCRQPPNERRPLAGLDALWPSNEYGSPPSDFQVKHASNEAPMFVFPSPLPENCLSDMNANESRSLAEKAQSRIRVTEPESYAIGLEATLMGSLDDFGLVDLFGGTSVMDFEVDDGLGDLDSDEEAGYADVFEHVYRDWDMAEDIEDAEA